MAFETILVDVSDHILTITLNRPARMNAFTTTMMREMVAALDRADADDAVRAVIVTGSGDRAFCAGADLGGGGTTFDYESRAERLDGGSPIRADGSVDWSHSATRDTGGRLNLRIFNCRKPVIGAVNGAAVGIGATMLLPMDFRLASTTARFGYVFARRGIVPDGAASWFLPHLVGIETALEWSYSGKVFDAEEALSKKLVRALHAPEDLLPAARALAHELTADSAPVSVAMTRQMLWRMLGAPHPMDAHRMESRMIWARGGSADAAEGVAAFLEKRPAAFGDKVSDGLPHEAAWFQDPDYA